MRQLREMNNQDLLNALPNCIEKEESLSRWKEEVCGRVDKRFWKLPENKNLLIRLIALMRTIQSEDFDSITISKRVLVLQDEYVSVQKTFLGLMEEGATCVTS
jgi:hypothetical protein